MKTIPCIPITIAALGLWLSTVNALDFNSTVTVTGPEAGGVCAITTDSAGRLHSVWTRERDGGGRELKYTLQLGHTHLQGGHQVRDFSAGAVPEHIDIAVDKLGAVHLAYVLSTGQVIYAFRAASDSGWTFASISTEAETGAMGGCSIDCVSFDGERVAIAFTGVAGTLQVCTNFNGGFFGHPFPSNVSTIPGIGYEPSLTYSTHPLGLAQLGLAVSHFDANLQALRIHELIFGSSLQATTIDSDGIAGRHSSIAALPNGDLGISYQMSDPGTGASQLRYACGADGKFEKQTVDASSDYGTPPDGSVFTVAQQTALSLDAHGNPMIAYTQGQLAFIIPATQQIRFARLIPGFGWDKHQVEPTPGGSGVTDGFDMATNGAGDPTILFESDAGTTSTLRLARPTTRPFVIESPQFLVEGGGAVGFSAPSIVTAPNGTIYDVLTTVSNGITRFFVSFDAPGGKRFRYQIPNNDFHRVNSTALAWTPDGLVHIFSMQVNSPNASSGELRYATLKGHTVSSNPVLSVALPVPPSVVTTPEGTVHLAFVHSSGELRYMTKAPGEASFTTRHARDLDGGRGLSIDAAPGGRVAIAFVHPASGEVRIISNTFRDGSRGSEFDQQAAYTPSGGDPVPKNAAVRFVPDGTPRVFFGLANTVRLARPTLFGFPLYTSNQVAGGLSNAYVDLHAGDCESLIGIAASEDGDGTARYLKFTHAGTLLESNTFLRHGRNAYTYDHHASAIAPAVNSALDPNGYPIAALPVRGDGVVREEVLIARAADGIDDDGDGVPLAAENAYSMDPAKRDAELAARVVTKASQPAGSRHDYFYRAPSYITAVETLSNGSVIGEFEYTITASTDLRCFTNPLDPTFPTGVIILGGGATNLANGLTEKNLRILFNSAFAAANPRAFARFRVLRRR